MPLRAALSQEKGSKPHVCCCGLHGVRRMNFVRLMKKKFLHVKECAWKEFACGIFRRNVLLICHVYYLGLMFAVFSLSED